MNHFFVIEGKVDADNEDAAYEFLYDLLFNNCEFKIKITGTDDT